LVRFAPQRNLGRVQIWIGISIFPGRRLPEIEEVIERDR
jgi:hypothetical protein